MKIVIAPDSYKESLSALEVATQIEAGFREVFPDWQYRKVPVGEHLAETGLDLGGDLQRG
ncbi:glycerate kinase, partial [Xanthomonas perforans]